jgi:hypothetical protein
MVLAAAAAERGRIILGIETFTEAQMREEIARRRQRQPMGPPPKAATGFLPGWVMWLMLSVGILVAGVLLLLGD